jgi:hypothetical protein
VLPVPTARLPDPLVLLATLARLDPQVLPVLQVLTAQLLVPRVRMERPVQPVLKEMQVLLVQLEVRDPQERQAQQVPKVQPEQQVPQVLPARKETSVAQVSTTRLATL